MNTMLLYVVCPGSSTTMRILNAKNIRIHLRSGEIAVYHWQAGYTTETVSLLEKAAALSGYEYENL